MVMLQLLWLALVAGLVLFPLLGLAPMAWRIFRRNEEPEHGGSLGRQLLGRNKRRAS